MERRCARKAREGEIAAAPPRLRRSRLFPGNGHERRPGDRSYVLLQRGDYGVTGGGSGALNRAQITEPEFTCPDIGDGISIVFGRRTVYETWVLPEPGVS